MARYTIFVTPDAWKEIKKLPGNLRQRVRREIDKLARNPRPAKSKELDLSELLENLPDLQLWRMRLESWRIVYAITEPEKTIDVLAVRKRPPYDYGDLGKLLGG